MSQKSAYVSRFLRHNPVFRTKKSTVRNPSNGRQKATMQATTILVFFFDHEIRHKIIFSHRQLHLICQGNGFHASYDKKHLLLQYFRHTFVPRTNLRHWFASFFRNGKHSSSAYAPTWHNKRKLIRNV